MRPDSRRLCEAVDVTPAASLERCGYPQAPAVHSSPAAHAVPHAPQLLPSVCKSEHVPEQSVVFDGQMHAPPSQTAASGQVTPHSPQLSRSVCRSTH